MNCDAIQKRLSALLNLLLDSHIDHQRDDRPGSAIGDASASQQNRHPSADSIKKFFFVCLANSCREQILQCFLIAGVVLWGCQRMPANAIISQIGACITKHRQKRIICSQEMSILVRDSQANTIGIDQ